MVRGSAIVGVPLMLVGFGALRRGFRAGRAQDRGAHGGYGSSAGAGANAASAHMSTDEALDILGLEPGADADEVRAAHKALMVKLHPDHGGSAWLAAKLNAAREYLLDGR